MLEQKHNKRAAISQASSNSNPNWPSPVTSAPSNPLRWTNLSNSWGERKQQATLPRWDQRWPAYFPLQMKASGRMTEAKRSRVLTNWNPKLSWQTKIYRDCGDLRFTGNPGNSNAKSRIQLVPLPASYTFSHSLFPSEDRLFAQGFLPYVGDANPTLKNLIEFALVQQLGMPGLLGF